MFVNAHLDLDVIAHETDDEVAVLVELSAPLPTTATEREPATLVVVLDRSGSMNGSRIDGAKSALLSLVDRLDPHDRFGLVAFDNRVEVVVPAGPLTDKAAVKRAIAAVVAHGQTDLSGGYLRGLQEAHRVAGAGGATVLLISDGRANTGICDPEQLGGIARKAHSDRIVTSALGFGLGYDERLLSAIASGGAGNELFAETADDAVTAIASEVSGLLEQAAQACSLLITMAPTVRGVRVLNELPSAAVATGVLVELGSFYAGETRKLVLTFDVPGIPALGLAEIATLAFRYVTLPGLEQQTVTVPLHVNVVPGDEAAGRLPNPDVRTELAFQQAQQAKREATTALSQGDVQAAGTALKRASTLLTGVAGLASTAAAAEIRDELALLEDMRTEAAVGDVTRAAKLMSADVTFKSRQRGRRRT